MDNSINSGISFQAKLVTNIKGRNNIMESVAKEFEKITKNIPGELKIKRATNIAEHTAEIKYGDVDYVSSELFRVLSKESADPKEIAAKMAGQLRIMMAESAYNIKAEPIEKSIFQTRRAIERAEHKLERAKRFGLDEVVNVVTDVVEGYKKQIPNLEKKLAMVEESAVKKMERYRDKCLDPLYIDLFPF